MDKEYYFALIALATTLYDEFGIDVREITPPEKVEAVSKKLATDFPDILDSDFDDKEAMLSAYNYFLDHLAE